MSHTFTLRIINQSTGSESTVAGEFPDDVWEVLCRFIQYAGDLLSTSMVRDGTHVTARLHGKKGKGITAQAVIPSSDKLAAFLHRLRPFVLQDEPTNFYKICNLVSRHIENAAVRDWLKELRSLYSGDQFRSQVRIEYDSVLINCEETLKQWLYGFEYHKDKSKQQGLQLLHKLLPLEYSRAIFMSMLMDKATAVLLISKCLIEAPMSREVTQMTLNI